MKQLNPAERVHLYMKGECRRVGPCWQLLGPHQFFSSLSPIIQEYSKSNSQTRPRFWMWPQCSEAVTDPLQIAVWGRSKGQLTNSCPFKGITLHTTGRPLSQSYWSTKLHAVHTAHTAHPALVVGSPLQEIWREAGTTASQCSLHRTAKSSKQGLIWDRKFHFQVETSSEKTCRD